MQVFIGKRIYKQFEFGVPYQNVTHHLQGDKSCLNLGYNSSNYRDYGCLYIYIWRFPKMMVPPNHPN